MRDLTAVWQALEPRRRIIVVLATLAMFAAVLALGKLATRPSMALLYAGLDEARAGEVLAALDQQGAVYEVRGAAIYVESPRRDQLRMSLAADGLPANSGAGYELLDSLSGFGTTSQMFDAAYLRAKEGELSRTIAALPQVRSARVHIADTRAQGLRAQARPTASVAVVTAAGALSAAHAKALKYLVASAVAGMSPDDVSVIDGEGALVDAGDEAGDAGGADRAEVLRRNVERLIEARVGYGNAVVQVAVETVTEREAITERRFDPEGRVAISTDTEERTNSSSDAGADGVTVASNLPTGDAEGGGASSQSRNSETRERTNFEVSETTRELLRTPGATRRLTVAVLVDDVPAVAADGAVTTAPRGEEELAALRDLVAAAVGYDEARGDVITIRSMPFEPIGATGEAPGQSILDRLGLDVMALAQLAVLAVVVLALGLFVVRPILGSRAARAAGAAMPALQGPALQGPGGPALTGVIDDRDFVPADLPVVAARPGRDGDAPPADPVERLRRMIADRKEETAEILRGWMEDPEEERT